VVVIDDFHGKFSAMLGIEKFFELKVFVVKDRCNILGAGNLFIIGRVPPSPRVQAV
jgi:hypothetical protein